MVSFWNLVFGAYLSASAAASDAGLGQREATKDEPRFRTSPIDGSTIALPTKEQLAWQDKEIGVLIHFEIATYLDIDGCNNVPDLVPNITLWDPTQLNTDQWMDSIEALGAKYATLVAKHNCGFALWPSKVSFPTRDGTTDDYNYTVADAPIHTDVVAKFVKSAKHRNIGHGFYYSAVVNNFLNVQDSAVRNTTLAPGQVGITNDTFNEIVSDQLTELWTNYGELTEIWFDGGYSSAQVVEIQKLLEANQPQAVIFNGCQTNGTCVSHNSIRWIGTEAGEAPEENWSTGVTNNGGDPESPHFCPSECDTTLQTEDRWFYGVGQPLRPLQEMIDVYHKTVGRNCFLELDLSPDRRGLVPDNHAARYKQLGDFIRSCYGEPVAHTNAHGGDDDDDNDNDEGVYSIKFDEPTSVDRISLMEDQTNGQVIRSYHVYAKIADENGVNDASDMPWTLVSNGTSVGHKKIDIFDEPISVTEMMVNSTYVDTPRWRSVTVHQCHELTASMKALSD